MKTKIVYGNSNKEIKEKIERFADKMGLDWWNYGVKYGTSNSENFTHMAVIAYER